MNDKPQAPKAMMLRPETTTDLITSLGQTDLITQDQAENLALATRDMAGFAKVGTPVGARHLGSVDTMLSVTQPTAVGKAREVLHELGEHWNQLKPDFHKYRKIYFEAKLLRAELAKLQKQIDTCDDAEDRAILEARYQLQLARVEEMESQVADGHQQLKDELEEATACSEKYQAILKDAKKKEFTPEEFLEEELEHYLKSAFWHAGQVFVVKEVVIADTPFGKQVNQFVRMQKEVLVYFEGLGITPKELHEEFLALNDMRTLHMQMNPVIMGGPPQSFRPYFEGWIQRTTQKYLPYVKDVVAERGIKHLQRIMQLLEPTTDDQGQEGPGDLVDRGSVFE